MSVTLPNLSWWLWSGKKKDAKLQKGSSLNSSPELNVVELDLLKFPGISGAGGNLASNSRRVRRKWSQDDGKIDKEHDVVLVPSDGGYSSDSDSDASDWSIGWSEPHASGFLSEDEIDGGFGVLVRCYGRGSGAKQDYRKNNSDNNVNVPELYSADSKKSMERWLSSLQGN
ncbi:hypothetical protein SOVF_158120 [Spinacia oleracea]|uniref:Uncharacterized protein n=1 Tax=Spinacia oleracea TaxID=3562 RepID=A0A9R0JS15_SPIOL|nr:uncharacterized protein LOC110784855 [Spinacia oleracea]KNA08942.1 hypothetical protein SOVF_158120 [Spinacia oleracea]